MTLTDRERNVLDLERDWWLSSPSKRQAIHERLGLSPAAYYGVLRRLASSPEAFAYDPLVVHRVRRRIVRRRKDRYEGPAFERRRR
ncbi:MAG: DUF3263 domain-containing protein [Acidimicrobiales bacterium]|jgi:hypothetical protein